jgi:hypothetical protein
MDGQELESSLTESAPRIFRSLKVRAEKVRRFPFWECAHESARFPNSRNTDARAEHTQAPISFLGMREIKILEHKKCGVQFNSPFDRSFWKSAHGKSAPLSFWECAHEPAHFPNSRNTKARKNAPISFLGMREIKFEEHKKRGGLGARSNRRFLWKSARD